MIGRCGKQRAKHADKLSKTTQTFVVKSIKYVGVMVFVVASENEKIFGIFNPVSGGKKITFGSILQIGNNAAPSSSIPMPVVNKTTYPSPGIVQTFNFSAGTSMKS